jgi:hypothetical protein
VFLVLISLIFPAPNLFLLNNSVGPGDTQSMRSVKEGASIAKTGIAAF